MGYTHITGCQIGGGTHITSDMCAGIHISRGYTYHCDIGTKYEIASEESRENQAAILFPAFQPGLNCTSG